MYDYLIIGSGLFGSVFAQQMTSRGRKCLVIDKRDHIGGNCYTKTEYGIDLHVYGPHIFHTSSREIWDYICQFTSFNNFIYRSKSRIGNTVYSFPINLMTLHQLWGVTTPAEAVKKLEEVRIPCKAPKNLEEWILSQVGREIYEKFVYGYTKKQWMRDPCDLPASIIRRIPIRTTYDDNYFNDTFQGIPTEGYTKIFERMLAGVEVRLGVDFFADRSSLEGLARKVVYTGKIDEYFDFCHGELQYRSLRFDHEVHEGDYQGNAIVNYPESDVPWTRITEHKHFTPERNITGKTLVTKEHPTPCGRGDTPYYPIGDEFNTERYRKYKEMADSCTNVIFGGRLAEYKYYDMHQVIASALHFAKKEFG